MLISTIPPQSLKAICNQWNQGDDLQELVGGQLFATVESIGFEDPDYIYLRTSTSITLEDCALMLWIQQQTDEPITVGCQWAATISVERLLSPMVCLKSLRSQPRR